MGQEEKTCNSENDKQEVNTLIEDFPETKCDYVRNKMNAMQKRIDKLKEKVKNEGELLNSEGLLKSDNLDNEIEDSLNSLQKNFEHTSENESDKSLYYSVSNYSLCSTSSSEIVFNNFTRFVNNFVKSQNPKERLSLLQLHSKNQISLNMMRHSLSELDNRCSEEMELIERSLRHLNRLAQEFNVNTSSDDGNESGRLKALGFHDSDNEEGTKIKVRSNPVFIWPHQERKSRLNVISNPAFSNIDKKDKSSIRG